MVEETPKPLFGRVEICLAPRDGARGMISVFMLAVIGGIMRTKVGMEHVRGLVFDGVFASRLVDATKYLQSLMRLPQTGDLDTHMLCALSARTGVNFMEIPLDLFEGKTLYAAPGLSAPEWHHGDPIFPKYLNQGSKGFAVLLLQVFLATYQSGQIHGAMRFTGKYGPKTAVRVEALQRELNQLFGLALEEDGNFGPATRGAIRDAYGLDFDALVLSSFGF